MCGKALLVFDQGNPVRVRIIDRFMESNGPVTTECEPLSLQDELSGFALAAIDAKIIIMSGGRNESDQSAS